MLGVPSAVYDIMPIKAKSEKLSDIITDLESAKLIGRQLSDISSLPKPFQSFLNSGSAHNPGDMTIWQASAKEIFYVGQEKNIFWLI